MDHMNVEGGPTDMLSLCSPPQLLSSQQTAGTVSKELIQQSIYQHNSHIFPPWVGWDQKQSRVRVNVDLHQLNTNNLFRLNSTYTEHHQWWAVSVVLPACLHYPQDVKCVIQCHKQRVVSEPVTDPMPTSYFLFTQSIMGNNNAKTQTCLS